MRFSEKMQDHPRLCGEKCIQDDHPALELGSPPPMRGKVSQFWDTCSRSRITPAYAGKSSQRHAGGTVLQDHPRLCGEKPVMRSLRPSCLGSPPPMRGKVIRRDRAVICSWITPAYAGKSGSWLEVSGRFWDHPRLCGEKPNGYVVAEDVEGSPPPMRGKVDA